MERPTNIRVTSREEGMPTGQVFQVIGWTSFDQPVVQEADGALLVLRPDDFVDAGFSGMRPGLGDKNRAMWSELAKRDVRIMQLREALAECADDLESEINARYPPSTRIPYPGQENRYQRDMEVVRNARAALSDDVS